MSEEVQRQPSIRRRLLIFLISSLLLMICGAALVTYSVAVRSTNNAYDRSLLDPAFDIADNVSIDVHGAHVDLPQKALEALVYDQVDKVIFQVRSPADAIIDGVTDLPAPPAFKSEQFMFFDSTYRGEEIRVAALHAHNGFVVQVGETLHKRNRLVGEILAAELVPAILIAGASIALAWFGVARGLVPLEHLRSELDSRAPRDLRPLSAKDAPAEIAPVINAFNGLLVHLREANLLQQRFLANAAHQLRTPLSGLQMHLELLLRHELPDTIKAQVERMHTATVRASRLANQLLALAKAESAADEGQDLELMDLRGVADAAARDWAMTAHEQKIDLGFALERAVTLGDPLLLPELLDNLLDNALRYTPRGGSITVSTGCEGDVPYLKVEDTGPGIPDAERSKVVERFYRIAGTPGEGSGLGLSIVREVVDRHGGKLHISSCGEHGGTSITVSFPRARAKSLPRSDLLADGSEA